MVLYKVHSLQLAYQAIDSKIVLPPKLPNSLLLQALLTDDLTLSGQIVAQLPDLLLEQRNLSGMSGVHALNSFVEPF
jgi:hypothetical protein